MQERASRLLLRAFIARLCLAFIFRRILRFLFTSSHFLAGRSFFGFVFFFFPPVCFLIPALFTASRRTGFDFGLGLGLGLCSVLLDLSLVETARPSCPTQTSGKSGKPGTPLLFWIHFGSFCVEAFSSRAGIRKFRAVELAEKGVKDIEEGLAMVSVDTAACD